MSYARFGENSSDVYIFLTRDEAGTALLECCGCLLQEVEYVADEGAFFGFYLKAIPDEKGEFVKYRFSTTQDMLDHLELHENAGHQIPESIAPRMLKDDKINFGAQ